MNPKNRIKIIDENQAKLIVWRDIDSQKKPELSKRDFEQLQVQTQLQELSPNSKLEHLKNGAPIIKNSNFSFVSISHYNSWYALYLCQYPIGVDIQPLKKSLVKGKFYYINKEEEHFDDSIDLHLIWSAKEAFYKMMQGEINDLRVDVTILDINTTHPVIKILYKNNKYILHYYKTTEYVLVWCRQGDK